MTKQHDIIKKSMRQDNHSRRIDNLLIIVTWAVLIGWIMTMIFGIYLIIKVTQ